MRANTIQVVHEELRFAKKKKEIQSHFALEYHVESGNS